MYFTLCYIQQQVHACVQSVHSTLYTFLSTHMTHYYTFSSNDDGTNPVILWTWDNFIISIQSLVEYFSFSNICNKPTHERFLVYLAQNTVFFIKFQNQNVFHLKFQHFKILSEFFKNMKKFSTSKEDNSIN